MTPEQIEEFEALYKKSKYVSPENNTDEANFAITMPQLLLSTDERFFAIKEWNPHCVVGETVSIDCKLLVRIPDDSKR